MKILMISRPTLFDVPGGDTVQVVETANELRAIGVTVDIKLADEKIDYSSYNLIHFFNIIRPNNIIPHIIKSKLPYVVSTIFVDYTEVEKRYRGPFARLLFNLFGADGIEYLKTIARFFKNNEKMVDTGYLFRGHKQSIRMVLDGAKLLLPNSESEFIRLKKRYRFKGEHKTIPNGVIKAYFSNGVAKDDRENVICVARIEPIKNQLNLIRALNETAIPLKIIGSPSPNRKAYYDLCKKEAADNISFLGHLSTEEVMKEYRKAKVHVLPSWFETTGLSSLEAAASACNIVITANGDTVEYFGSDAYYCEPESIKSIKEAIEKALNNEVDGNLKQQIAQKFTWERAALETLEAYKKVLKQTTS